MTFDTLSYARRLKQAGVPEAQAEAMADATRELVMQDNATKGDIAALRSDIAFLRAEFDMKLELLRRDMTIRLGGMIVVGVGLIIALMRIFTLHP